MLLSYQGLFLFLIRLFRLISHGNDTGYNAPLMNLRTFILLFSVFCAGSSCAPKKSKQYQKHIAEELNIPRFDFVLIGQIVEELHKRPYYNAPMNLPKPEHFSKSQFLEEEQLNTFSKALASNKNNSMSADCFFPSHSLIFYQKDKPLAHLWICTSCRVFNLYLPDGDAREISPDTKLIRQLIEAHDMTYFTRH